MSAQEPSSHRTCANRTLAKPIRLLPFSTWTARAHLPPGRLRATDGSRAAKGVHVSTVGLHITKPGSHLSNHPFWGRRKGPLLPIIRKRLEGVGDTGKASHKEPAVGE